MPGMDDSPKLAPKPPQPMPTDEAGEVVAVHRSDGETTERVAPEDDAER